MSDGGMSDEALLSSLQKSSLQINFFHYTAPIAPWSAARKRNESVSLESVLRPVREHGSQCELLLVEGAGGLLTPLGERFTAAEIITELRSEVIVVAANRLGVLNHTTLTVEALRHRGVQSIRIALAEHAGADGSRKSNLGDLTELLKDVPVVNIPFLANYRADPDFLRTASKAVGQELELLLALDPIAAKKNALDTEAEGTFP